MRSHAVIGLGGRRLAVAASALGFAGSAAGQFSCLHFSAPKEYLGALGPGLGVSSVASADLNGDGLRDFVVTARSRSHGPFVLTAIAPGQFGAPLELDHAELGSDWACPNDFDSDGIIDIVTTPTYPSSPNQGIFEFAFYKGIGDGRFEPRRAFVETGSGYPTSMQAADFDGDGDCDLVVARWAPAGPTSSIHLLRNNGGAQFASSTLVSFPVAVFYVGAADLDSDGDMDVIAPGLTGLIRILRNSGQGEFAEWQVLQFPYDPINGAAANCAAPADLDGDGDIDLAVCGGAPQNVIIFKNDGLGQFELVATLGVAGMGWHIQASDMDGDALPDLLLSNTSTINGGITGGLVLRNKGDGETFSMPANPIPTSVPRVLAAVDLDGFGGLDLALADIGRGVLWTSLNLTPQGGPCVPDLDDDYVVGAGDVSMVLSQWRRRQGAADVNGDHIVNSSDVGEVLGSFGMTVAAPPGWVPEYRGRTDSGQGTPGGVSPWLSPAADLNGDGRIDSTEQSHAIAEFILGRPAEGAK